MTTAIITTNAMQPPMMPHIAASDRPEFVRAPASEPPVDPDVVSPVGDVGGGAATTRRKAAIINNNSLCQNSSWQHEATCIHRLLKTHDLRIF